ncbi:MAG: DUF1700 domain-containing protein [Acholeplasmatales bacterium]|nr:DUF1700 domain-containing protein [Acholeplasmatales bacterium]
MKKKEFLTELRYRLRGLPKDEIDQRVEFYSEMIDDSIEDGLTEEKAVENIGSIDEVVRTVASETSLLKIMKHQRESRPRRRIRPWEIVLLILGFPLWFPLLIVFLVLCLVLCILLWILPIVTYSAFAGVLAGGVGSIAIGVANAVNGKLSFGGLYAGAGIAAVGAAILIFFVALLATKVTIKLNKLIFTGIKVSFIGRGERHE